jgi:hypothetical protein
MLWRLSFVMTLGATAASDTWGSRYSIRKRAISQTAEGSLSARARQRTRPISSRTRFPWSPCSQPAFPKWAFWSLLFLPTLTVPNSVCPTFLNAGACIHLYALGPFRLRFRSPVPICAAQPPRKPSKVVCPQPLLAILAIKRAQRASGHVPR